MSVIFETKIINIGKYANEMLKESNLLIFFGESVPKDLSEFCYLIQKKNLTTTIKKGDQLTIGEQKFKITAVGELVEKNLLSLGHITVSFDGSVKASLPGTLHVEAETLPIISKGNRILIN